jgi:hypothetical protein
MMHGQKNIRKKNSGIITSLGIVREEHRVLLVTVHGLTFISRKTDRPKTYTNFLQSMRQQITTIRPSGHIETQL